MNRRKLLVGLLLLALLGILFSAGGFGPSVQWAGGGAQSEEMAGSGQTTWAGGRDAYRTEGGARDSTTARSRDAYRR